MPSSRFLFATIVKWFDTMAMALTITSKEVASPVPVSTLRDWTSRWVICVAHNRAGRQQKARGTKNRPFCDNIWYKLKARKQPPESKLEGSGSQAVRQAGRQWRQYNLK